MLEIRSALAVILGASAIACVATPFAVVAQRHAPKPPALAAVTHEAVAVHEEVLGTTIAPVADQHEPIVHTFRVSDLASGNDAHVSVVNGVVGKHAFLAAITLSGMSPKEAHRVLVGFSGVKNLDRVDARDAFSYAKAADGHVIAFELVPAGSGLDQGNDSLDFFQEHEEADTQKLTAKRISIPIQKRVVTAGIVVGGDLHGSLTNAGFHDEISTLLDDALDGHAEISDLRAGTRLRIVATEEHIEGAFASYGPIDAIEYTPVGKPAIRIYWFAKGTSTKTKHGGYYDASGKQPYHGGWRSPVPMARISSRFDPNRMHPVLHVVMPHNGVDFAAPSGTPVYAAASGVIRSAGDSGPCGNMVQIDHPNGLTSAYCHLSKFGPITVGEHVETRQLIAYVGQTGRATGPHLHFAVKRGEIFLDPLSMKLDGVRVIPTNLKSTFEELKKSLDTQIDGITLPDTAAKSEPDPEDPGE